jgi:Kdo2-lipid IVA lauroyltransferase/acyltransferase
MTTPLSSFLTGAGFRLMVFIIRLMPYRFMYFLSDGLAGVLQKVIRYRMKVVTENLAVAGIPASKELLGKIYQNLSDILLEGIRSFSMKREDVEKRHRIINPEILQPFYAQGTSVILVTGHLSNWEWGSFSTGLQLPFRIVGFYKPLKNKVINRMIAGSRSRYGTLLAPIRKTSLTFEEHKGTPSLYVMVADQSPTKPELAIWVNFMGRDTAFLHGPEKHARNNDYPVVFCEINRIRRGYYEVEFSVLCERPSVTKPGEITERFARMLETTIRKTPGNWLWTHRRWKHRRTDIISDRLSA